ncbi:class I SAM-dependent methyltransferase [Winogradskyella aurantiaca]|uniref:class I SAM-dependent methyltransferase n=1 Tax=Winogradskyella aurantiaca TaxID=2219558 RepID=UPI000E1D2054|nr:class I SAM-dependent methyltransferase [Winogradskyella aurantiaca]
MGLKSKVKEWLVQRQLPIQEYKPKKKGIPPRLLEIKSAWIGLEAIIEDILEQFDINRDSCIEFGVEFGYSSVVFSNYFKNVTGVDIFCGDIHTLHKEDHYETTKENLKDYSNITLHKSDYKDWIVKDTKQYDFAHVDIIHNYKETYECGLWAVEHSKCCIFHDTNSFPEVRKAVIDIAKDTGKSLYNYPYHYGLGIIV